MIEIHSINKVGDSLFIDFEIIDMPILWEAEVDIYSKGFFFQIVDTDDGFEDKEIEVFIQEAIREDERIKKEIFDYLKNDKKTRLLMLF